MKGISKKELELISRLELSQKYFFTSEEVDAITKNKTQRYNLIKTLAKKGRIVKLNKNKYYLIPVKSTSGGWSEHPFIIADEICNGKDYFIGGWAAAKHWKLTDQVPMQIDIYTTRRQGKANIMNTRFVFHRTTPKKTRKAVKKEIQGHMYKTMPYEDTKKWLKKRK